jgi:hypothetical protein
MAREGSALPAYNVAARIDSNMASTSRASKGAGEINCGELAYTEQIGMEPALGTEVAPHDLAARVDLGRSGSDVAGDINRPELASAEQVAVGGLVLFRETSRRHSDYTVISYDVAAGINPER